MLSCVIWFDLIGAVRSPSCLTLGWWCMSSVLPPSVRGRMFRSHFPLTHLRHGSSLFFFLSHHSSVTCFLGMYEMCVCMKMLVLFLLLYSAWNKDDRTLDGQNFFFLILIYLFSCTRSLLRHRGPSIFVFDLSCSMWDLVPWPGADWT